MRKPKTPKAEPQLHVKILSPTQTFYDGQAVSVSATNAVGPFDILPNHANFFSLLAEGEVVINNGFQSFSFPVTKGIMKAANNIVTLFVDVEQGYQATKD